MRAQSSTLLLRSTCALHPKPQHLPALPPVRRFTNALHPLQTLTATRILPYPAKDVYNIIADIAAYPSFIPYCTYSRITSHSAPDSTHNRKWPRVADLRIGYAGYDERYTSRVYCDPYRIIEAVAGEAEPTISPQHYTQGGADEPATTPGGQPSGDLLSSLLSRWTFREFPYKPNPPAGTPPQEGDANANPAHPRTEVNLLLEVRFASAVYSALSQAAAPKIAGMMIDVFEQRAKEVLGRGHGPVEEATGVSGKAAGHAAT